MPSICLYSEPAEAVARLRRPRTGGVSPGPLRSTSRQQVNFDQLTLMPTLTDPLSSNLDSYRCDVGRCDDAACMRCARVRAEAATLAADGRTTTEIAERLHLPEYVVERHLHAGLPSRPPERLRKISNAPLRELIEARMRSDADFTLAELARRAGIPSQTHLERLLGYKKTSDCVKHDRFYPGSFADDIPLTYAARIVRALNVDPREVEGL